MFLGSQAQAFECPMHFQAADAAIAKAGTAISYAESAEMLAAR